MANNLLKNPIGVAAIVAVAVLAISLFANVGTGAATDIIEYSCLTTRECTFNAMQCNAGTVCVNGACV